MRLFGSERSPSADPGLEAVVKWLSALAYPEPAAFFGTLVREAIDEVLDGPRTGRWDFGQLEPTEKTYVGTKIEIVVRAALGLERGSVMDLEIEGHPVDVKWSMTSAWQIPEEAVGHLCLCIGGLRGLSSFQVGVIRCTPEILNLGRNKDRKTTIRAQDRRAHMAMLVQDEPLPPNFVAEIPPAVRARVLAGKSIQERIRALFEELIGVPIPRGAIQTIARTDGDPMRRLRQDAHSDPLPGLRILSAKYGNGVVLALGRGRLAPDEFMGVPAGELEGIPHHIREQLSAAARERYGL